MHIRTFRAANLQAALAEIRQQMGPDASVLHTRQVRDGVLGWLGRTHVEVTAGLRESGEPPRRTAAAAVPPPAARPQGPPAVVSADADDATQQLRRQVEQLTATVQRIDRHFTATLPPTASELCGRLIDAGVPQPQALRWLQSILCDLLQPAGSCPEPAVLEDHLRRFVARTIHCGGPVRTPLGQRRVVALVGPTGVGKTTTIAKLAAGFRLQEQRRRVGLLTIDTYRIAAVQQLRAYAEIMDLPMEVVEQADQMPAALDRLGDVDLVLIDTAGRSPRFEARIKQLKRLLDAARPDEIHLVISATAGAAAVRGVLQGFAPVGPTATILTKLDETAQTAGTLAALETLAPPLSYLTTGQQVPEDIEAADADALAAGLLEPTATGRVAA